MATRCCTCTHAHSLTIGRVPCACLYIYAPTSPVSNASSISSCSLASAAAWRQRSMRRLITCAGARRWALVLGLVLAMSSCVAHGVRTAAPRALSGAGALLGKATPPAAAASRSTYGGQSASTTSTGQPATDDEEEEEGEMVLKERAVTGSRLPDCEHACGPCAPCRRVMVSFRCAQAAESCPIAYRCMCRGRFFRVPTL